MSHNLASRAALLYLMRLDDLWASLFRASSPPASCLTASSCTCGRKFAFRFFQLAPRGWALRSATVVVIDPDWLLSSNKILPMLGTLGCGPGGPPYILESVPPLRQSIILRCIRYSR